MRAIGIRGHAELQSRAWELTLVATLPSLPAPGRTRLRVETLRVELQPTHGTEHFHFILLPWCGEYMSHLAIAKCDTRKAPLDERDSQPAYVTDAIEGVAAVRGQSSSPIHVDPRRAAP